MGSYIQDNLAKDENIIAHAKISWLSQIWYFVFALIFTLSAISGKSLVLFIGAVILVVIAVINVLTTELAITNRRIIAKSGIISRNTIELKTNRVESLIVNQGIVGRILNFGSIVVKGVGGSSTPIPYISSPLAFRHEVNNYLDALDDKE